MSFYAARQPILNQDKELVGYELLYRTSLENIFPKVDEDKATTKMLDGLYFDMGLDKIAQGKTAFINFTTQAILDDLAAILPKELVTIEVLETVKPTKTIFEKLKKLADNGYTIALDDFIHSPEWEPFYAICKVIKVDCMDISDTELDELLVALEKYPHIQLLAEKVENNEIFEKYKAKGFTLFQGYFFAKPEVIKSVSLSAAQTAVTNLLSEVTKPEVDTKAVIQMFETDAALSFRLLKYVQSPIFRRNKKIESIRQAVIILGKVELERFVSMLFAATFSESKPSELTKLSLQRAKFCELLSERLTDVKASSSFLFGMMSLLGAMLDADLSKIIESLPLTDDIKLALVKHIGILADFLALCQSLELAQWDKITSLAAKLNVPTDEVFSFYQMSNEWADSRLESFM